MLAIAMRIIKQMKSRKRLLAAVLIAPALVLTFTYMIFSVPDFDLYIATVEVPEQLNEALVGEFTAVMKLQGETDATLGNKYVDAVIYMQDGKIVLKMYEPDNIKNGKSAKITEKVTRALKSANPNQQELEISFLYGDAGQSLFDSLGFAFLGIFSFVSVFLLTAASLIKERTSGTMERLMLSPVSRYGVVAGFMLGYGFFAAIQNILTVFYAKYVLHLAITGSFWNVVLIMMLLSLSAVALGFLVSLLSSNEFHVMQFIPLIIIPQVFFSGIVPVDMLSYNLDKLAYLTPVYFACGALKEVMLKGAGFAQLLLYYEALLLFVLILIIINVLMLRKYRKGGIL